MRALASLSIFGPPRTYAALTALALGLGVFLRCVGYFGDDLQLWLDEASWARTLVEGNYAWIRPAGYMWVTRQLLEIANNEQMLRALSLFAGIAQLPLLFAVLRLSLRSRWIATLGVYLLAIHPVAIAMSKEFKPYAFEATLHTVLMLWALAYCATDQRRHMVGLSVTAVVAPLFAWSVVFAYPAVFAVAGLRALRSRRTLDAVIGIAGVVSTLIVLATIWALKVAEHDEKTEFWGKKYGVFYLGDDTPGLLSWIFGKSVDLAALPAQLSVSLPIPAWEAILSWLFLGACAIGTISLLIRRRWMLATLWLLPWVIAVAFNLAGKWPYGVFRTNVFLLFYALGLCCHGFDAVAMLLRRSPVLAHWLGTALVILLTLSVFPVDLAPFRTKEHSTLSASTSVRTAMDKIYEVESAEGATPQKGRRLLLLDGHACHIFKYYAEYHSETTVLYGDFFKKNFETRCSGVKSRSWKRLIKRYRSEAHWVLSAKAKFVEITRKEVRRRCTVLLEEELPATTMLMRCERARTP